MNVYFIRTKLQCLIAKKINKKINESGKYSIVFLHQNSKTEDSLEVYKIYEQFRNDAHSVVDVVSSDGIIKNFFDIISLLKRIKRKNLICYVAVVDNLPVALSLRIMRIINLTTFDDGAFNIIAGSTLYGQGPMRGFGLKKIISRIIFPEGGAEWMRQKSQKHYTIFNSKINIVSQERIQKIEWNWEELLEKNDLGLLEMDVKTVVIGTPHDEYPDPVASRNKVKILLTETDLYVRHPRETIWFDDPRAKYFLSPAESILIELAKRRPIKVYHFNSTIGYTLSGFNNIELINLVDPLSRRLMK